MSAGDTIRDSIEQGFDPSGYRQESPQKIDAVEPFPVENPDAGGYLHVQSI
jgi:hypothetical protein